jgi:monoamine oxidase
MRVLQSVTALPTFKAFACFDEPWWAPLGKKGEMALTDLPMRVAQYGASEGAEDAHERPSLLLATLCHSRDRAFFASLLEPSERAPYDGRDDWARYASDVDGPLVRELRRELSEVHGRAIPAPYAAAQMDWGGDPFGGAGHFWNVHAPIDELVPRAAQPIAGLPVFVCGEAYARSQGWVEGALETAEHVMQRHFDLPRPDWLDEGDA